MALRSRPPVLAVAGDAGTLVTCLAAAAASAGVGAMRGAVALRLSKRDRPVAVLGADAYAFDEIVVTAGFDGCVIVDGDQRQIEGRVLPHRHLLLRFRPRSLRPFSYVHFVVPSRIVRVADVTRTTTSETGTREDEFVLVQVRRGDEIDDPAPADLVRLLRRHRLLRRGANVAGTPIALDGIAHDRYPALSRLAAEVRGLRVLDTHGDLSGKLAQGLSAGDLRRYPASAEALPVTRKRCPHRP